METMPYASDYAIRLAQTNQMFAKYPAKTPHEIEALKRNWESDPYWDIEETDGFEEYQAELLAYRLQKEAEWKEQYQQRLLAKAEELGVPGNTKLAEYVLDLECRLNEMNLA